MCFILTFRDHIPTPVESMGIYDDNNIVNNLPIFLTVNCRSYKKTKYLQINYESVLGSSINFNIS